MQKELSHTKNRGFSLVEVIVSSALVLILSLTFIQATLAGQSGTQAAGMRARATLVAEEALEAVHNIRDFSFLGVTDGTYGLTQAGGTWSLSGSSDTQGPFTRTITISSVDVTTKLVTAKVSWTNLAGTISSTSLSSYVTDFSLLIPEAKSLQVDVSGGHTTGGNKVVGIKIKNIGGGDIYLSSTTIAWVGGNGNTFTKVSINGATPDWASTGGFYPVGAQTSSSTVGFIAPVKLQKNSQSPLNVIEFDGNMKNAVLTITFIMSDNSAYTTVTPPL